MVFGRFIMKILTWYNFYMTPQKLMPWYQLSLEKITAHLQTDLTNGLLDTEIPKRQKRYGENIFEEEKQITIFGRILAQLKNPLVIILLGAGIATFFLKEYTDTIVIFFAFLINVLIGVTQESRASKAFQTLLQSQEKYATVIRNGEKKIITANGIVSGDVIEINAGSYIPADARIISEQGLSVNESALTGEWVAVAKDAVIIAKEVPITEQTNMVWMGTLATEGSANAIVVGIGNNTQVGAIAKSLIETTDESTPLQKSIHNLARFLTFLILGIIAIIFVIGLINEHSLLEMLLLSIAVAVAAMPQGLPAAVTVVLALGMESILKKGGLVRNLLAAETLGSTTIILTDKTGTLTMAEMRVAEIATLQSIKKLDARTTISRESKLHTYDDDSDVLKMAMLTSDAFVEGMEKPLSEWVVRGRPVERAIMLAGLDSGFHRNDLLKTYPQIDFLPFESKRRFAASLHSIKNHKRNRLYISGAPEFIIEKAGYIYLNGKAKKITDAIKSTLIRIQEQKSAQGMRLIAIGYKETSEKSIPVEIEHISNEIILENIIFGGFIILHDPLREDVKEAIQTAKEAGTRVIMLTGDNPVTALKIAVEAGIAPKKSKNSALTGAEIEELDDDKLLKALKKAYVFARVLPHQKLRIARLLKADGEVVAMTGDGINDAPALRNADIGVALNSGTEVAKEASDIILLNNSFSIIIGAIEEGRRILDNLKKIVAYLLSTSFSEIIIVGAALIAGTPIPLLPTQILWTNIIEEGFMNFSFAFEPKEKDVMKRNPRDIAMKHVLTSNLKRLIMLIAGITGALLVLLYFFLLYINMPEEEIRTLMFIAVSIDSIFFAFSIKNLHRPVWRISLLSNKYLIAALLLSFVALILAITLPPLQTLLSIAPPSSATFLALIGLGIANLVVIEAAKYIVFERPAQKFKSSSAKTG